MTNGTQPQPAVQPQPAAGAQPTPTPNPQPQAGTQTITKLGRLRKGLASWTSCLRHHPKKFFKSVGALVVGAGVVLGGYHGIRALTPESQPYFGQEVKVIVEYKDESGKSKYKDEWRFISYDKDGKHETIKVWDDNSKLEKVIESYDGDDIIGNHTSESLTLHYTENVDGEEVPKKMVFTSNYIQDGDKKKYDRTTGCWGEVSKIRDEKLKDASKDYSTLKAIVGKEFPKRFNLPKKTSRAPSADTNIGPITGRN